MFRRRRTKVLTTNLFILFLVKEEEPAHPIWSPALKLAAAVVALILALFGGLEAIALLSLLVILLAIQMSYGLWVWFR